MASLDIRLGGLSAWVRTRRTIRSADADAEDIQHQRGLG
jgi:hypothetical protein